MRIVNDVTLDLGLETHVCEVKLLLADFAQIKVSHDVSLVLLIFTHL